MLVQEVGGGTSATSQLSKSYSHENSKIFSSIAELSPIAWVLTFVKEQSGLRHTLSVAPSTFSDDSMYDLHSKVLCLVYPPAVWSACMHWLHRMHK